MLCYLKPPAPHLERAKHVLGAVRELVFETSRKIDTEKGLYNQFSVSSKADIQKVINFFSRSLPCCAGGRASSLSWS